MERLRHFLVTLRRVLANRRRNGDDIDALMQEALLRLQVYGRDRTAYNTEVFWCTPPSICQPSRHVRAHEPSAPGRLRLATGRSDQVSAQLCGSVQPYRFERHVDERQTRANGATYPAEQQQAIIIAQRMAGAGFLIPANKTTSSSGMHTTVKCKAAGLSHMYGLRHQNAQSRYEILAGCKAPLAGGPNHEVLFPSQRALDAEV